MNLPNHSDSVSLKNSIVVANLISQSMPKAKKGVENKKKGVKMGRPAKHDQFPSIAETTEKFLRGHGFAAQQRRRTSTALGCGVTLGEIQNHLLHYVPGLREAGISKPTVHRLMMPPRQGTTSGKRYKGVVKARIPHKSNNATKKKHVDLHFCRTQSAMMSEACAFFQDECLRISCDDKNKVNVGTLAVSRYHQITRFYMDNDCPDYLDHDFPYRNSKIIPSGY